jgi:thiosulfate/3-mercaptopyruvate sulfurtransferase
MQAVAALACRWMAFAAVLGGIVFAAVPQMAQAETVPSLVDAAWLLEHNGTDGVVVLDVRNELGDGSEAVYRQGHIPGAVYSNYLRSGWRTERDGVPAQLPLVETMEALIGELGIGNESHVVVVAGGKDALDMASAARVYWTFKVLGHDRVSILDGGYRAYTADPANPVEQGWVDPLPNIFSADLRAAMVAGHDDVEALLRDGGLLVDTRPVDYYLGRKRHTWAKRAGTIPGAQCRMNSSSTMTGAS